MRFACQYKGAYPLGCIVTFTEEGIMKWKPGTSYYYIKNLIRENASFKYSLRGCTQSGKLLKGWGMAWVAHEHITPVED